MKLLISKTFRFEAAHKLVGYDGDCANLHGHSYVLEVCVKDEVSNNGMVMDFKELKNIVSAQVIDILDHQYLNDMFGNPTAENILIWIIRKLQPQIPTICRVKLWETTDSFVEWGASC